ncbi:MAG: hypothetical protein VW452_00705 [Pelagibacteraceae bacterium]|jgi:hypothetical protein
MEKLITKKNITILVAILTISAFVISYYLYSNQKENQNLFDIYLSGLYNDENSISEEQLNYLSSIENPNVSFFADLKKGSIDNLNKYNKLDKDLILLKNALKDLDIETIRSLSLDDSFIFSDIVKIYLINDDFNNLDDINTENNDNFFIKAVNRLENENS